MSEVEGFKFMFGNLKYPIMTGVLIGIILDVSGNGIFDYYQCSKKFGYERCLGIGGDQPENLMSDFYTTLQVEPVARNINHAWDLLSKEVQLKYDNLENGVQGKNYFYNFWGKEAEDFKILKQTFKYDGVAKSIADLTFTLCYKRNRIYAKETKMPEYFCSFDKYHLIKKREYADSPYLWSIDKYDNKLCKQESQEDLLCKQMYGNN